MLRSRVIPCLLIHQKGLVKTVKFKSPKYVGDPINAVKIFNEKEVDELIVLDINATVNNVEPNFQMIEYLANESRMPLCYGGGVKTVEQAQKIIKLGIEKVALSSAAITNPNLLVDIASVIGAQSVVVVLDVKKTMFGSYEIYSHNGKKKVNKNLFEFIAILERIGIGELVINSIDNDGVMKGYDLTLIKKVRDCVNLPLTVLGGAGSVDDILNIIDEYKIIGASAGSLFVFKGKYKAVLISYLSDITVNKIRLISKM
tara:strand:- start:269 stop:1042 length:774 start_codon:yes stop_codon:yes gene_type:complete